MNLADDARRSGRDSRHGLFIFKLQNGLILGHRVAFFDEDIDHDAGIRALA
jgi:hypothetical protein